MRILLRAAFLICVTFLIPAVESAETVPLWGIWTRAFRSTSASGAETDVAVELRAPSGRRHTATAFWDGQGTWRVRFMPTEEGTWRYQTRSRPGVRGLDRASGNFRCARGGKEAHRFLRHGPARVSTNGRYLEHTDGTPFFWLGDTVWNGVLLSSKDDWDTFLDDRASKNFTAIQFVMTAPWRTAPTNAEGQVAFNGREKIEINPRFFDRIDQRMDAINARGLLAVPVLLWAIRGDENPGHYLPEDQAIRLIRYMVARYGVHHVVWIPAGDARYEGEVAERWKRICRAVFGAASHAPVVMHPGGMQWPWDAFLDENWLDMIGYQSGHGDDANTLRWIHSGPPAQKWRESPPRPFLNLEPPYEDHLAYQSRKPHSAYNVRRAAYWSLLNAPQAGLTYGAHGIWSWETTPRVPLNHNNTGIARPWREAMALPGSTHMKHLADFLTSLPWWRLRPDEDLLVSQPGGDDPARHVSAARADDGDVAVLYLPAGGEVEIRARDLRQATWFDPRTGKTTPASSSIPGKYQAPDDHDWILVLKRR